MYIHIYTHIHTQTHTHSEILLSETILMTIYVSYFGGGVGFTHTLKIY